MRLVGDCCYDDKGLLFLGTLSTILGMKLNKEICALCNCVFVCPYTCIILSVSLAENGQINESQRSVSCAQINQSTVDTRDVAQARQRLQRVPVPDKDTTAERDSHKQHKKAYICI